MQNNVRQPATVVQDVSQLLIYNDDAELIAALWRRGDGTLALTRLGEPDFEQLCREAGFHRREAARGAASAASK